MGLCGMGPLPTGFHSARHVRGETPVQFHPTFTQKVRKCRSWSLLVWAARLQKPEAAEGDFGGHLMACAEKSVWQHGLGRNPSWDLGPFQSLPLQSVQSGDLVVCFVIPGGLLRSTLSRCHLFPMVIEQSPCCGQGNDVSGAKPLARGRTARWVGGVGSVI